MESIVESIRRAWIVTRHILSFLGEGINCGGEKTKWCCHNFSYVFAVFVPVWILVPAGAIIATIFGTKEFPAPGDINPFTSFWLIILAVLGVLSSFTLGHRVYERWVGPRLREWGWNEYSAWRGWLVLFSALIVFFFVPVALLIGLALVF